MNESRKKNPRAPSIALGDAIEKALVIYEKERRHPVPLDVVAQDIGYKSANNGTALSVLASLRYFGLLERPKEGHLAATKDVEKYRFAPSEGMRQELRQKWLREPPVFADLIDQFAEGLPSDATVRYELIQRGFTPNAAESVLDVFRRSIQFAGFPNVAQEMLSATVADQDAKGENGVDEAPTQVVQARMTKTGVAMEPEMRLEPDADMRDRIPVRLPGGRRAWLVIPTPFYEADKKRLIAQIELLLADDEE